MIVVISFFYLIENLRIKIIVTKAGLKNDENRSIHSVTWLKKVLNNYMEKQVIKCIRSIGLYKS
ncbi:hypothetical protein SASC256_09340 [Staphylococcus argenteus]|nr:hypothetical protein SA19061_20610 [Staphylococcus argenteus]GJF53683.1 hypothetical protein SA19088_04260 [Staphylococcus argenteus]GJF60168.1 hypothetical protein SA19105_16560 [Staphylococcus argenteus]GJF73324.1 hypothetical protein SA19202_19320 [Staphylococcus argenteus]GJF84900.1 hypothetical protein SA20015_06090 [Staphylococcus argenteus]